MRRVRRSSLDPAPGLGASPLPVGSGGPRLLSLLSLLSLLVPALIYPAPCSLAETREGQGAIAGTLGPALFLPMSSSGELEGSYFPGTAELTVDSAQVGGSGAIADGGESFLLSLAPGTHYYRLNSSLQSVTGSFQIGAGFVTWEHFSLQNGTPGSGGGIWESILQGGYLDLLVGVGLGVVTTLLLWGIVRQLRQRSRGGGTPAPGPSEAQEAEPRQEALSPPSRSGGPHGLPGGDPPQAPRPGDTGP